MVGPDQVEETLDCLRAPSGNGLMDAWRHARISAKRRGGRPEDYYPLHAFIDSTKECCADMRHRVLHTPWAVTRVIIPVFGAAFRNSDGAEVQTKSVCEEDHLFLDYRNRFIPDLADFCDLLDASAIPDWRRRVEALHREFGRDADTRALLLSPLAVTGSARSLLITHNSWFLWSVLPKVRPSAARYLSTLSDVAIGAPEVFRAMRLSEWLLNGAVDPPSRSSVTSAPPQTEG